MAQPVSLGKQGFFATLRRDRWWVTPLIVASSLTLFGIYATVSALAFDAKFEVGPYISPFFEPLFLFDWWKFSPAIFILWAPLGFRATCYYFRGAYYKAYFQNPPACQVTGYSNKGKYRGESRGVLRLMNLHRFFLYVALILCVFLWIGAVKSFWYEGRLGIGLGSLVITLDAFLVTMYTLSCHSLRHLVGGRLDCFTCSAGARTGKSAWDLVSRWNLSHNVWAWTSLAWVGFTDLYVRLVAHGIITDPNTWGTLHVVH